jgi:hypothetical protein
MENDGERRKTMENDGERWINRNMENDRTMENDRKHDGERGERMTMKKEGYVANLLYK